MMHQFSFSRIDDDGLNAVFTCSACGIDLGFNLPGVGEPAAIAVGDGTYETPPNPDQWAVPCAA